MPSVEITESVSRRLHIDRCPCCGSSDVSAYSGHTYMDGEAYGVVHCQRCGHKVSEQKYGWSENTALESAVGAWNVQAKVYGGADAALKRENDGLRSTVAEKESVIRILKAMLASGDSWKIDPSITDRQILEQFQQTFG